MIYLCVVLVAALLAIIIVANFDTWDLWRHFEDWIHRNKSHEHIGQHSEELTLYPEESASTFLLTVGLAWAYGIPPEGLYTYGSDVRRIPAFVRYAAQIGKPVGALTNDEKFEAAVDVVLGEIDKEDVNDVNT
jgi:hypothetical protein